MADSPGFLFIKLKNMATIVVFASSLSLTSLLVLVKAVELKYGKKNAVLGFICRFDTKAVSLIAALKFKSLQLIQSIRYLVLVQSRAVLKDWFLKARESVMNEYNARQSMIMGRKNILNKGSVSFYLKKITENKGNGEKGKIE